MAIIPIDMKAGAVAGKQQEIIVGIDLGTTHSLVAYMQDGAPRCVAAPGGGNSLLPSLIYFAEDGSIVVGEEAREMLVKDPAHTIFSVKRLMGKSYNDLDAVKGLLGYKIIDEDPDALARIRIRDRFYTPVELSAEILKALKQRVGKQLGAEVTRAVVTVPAYFNDAQRQATRDAGRLAGLDILRVINEPTAASLAYGLDRLAAGRQRIAVYDLGGGTFDMSVLELQDGVFEVLATHGDTFLGGDDMDRAILEYWKASGLAGYPLSEDGEIQELRLLAESAKKALSEDGQWTRQWKGKTLSIDRAVFQDLVQPLIDRTLDSCRHALADAGLAVSDVEQVLLVGGSTRVVAVREAVASFFGREPHTGIDPDQVVALGAAIQADVLAGNQRDILLIDITPLSLGIETVGGLMDVLIPRNSKVPGQAARQYTTSVDGQRNLKISVYQGERDLVQHNRKLGEFILKGIPPMPAGLPKIEVRFIVNADGILTVRAKELRSGVEQEIGIRPQYGLSEEEMGRMLLDSIRHAESDMKTRAVVEARTEAGTVLLASEKFIRQNEGWLTSEEKAGMVDLADALRSAAAAESKDAIHEAMDRLNEYSRPLAERAMDYAVAEAMRGKKIQ